MSSKPSKKKTTKPTANIDNLSGYEVGSPEYIKFYSTIGSPLADELKRNPEGAKILLESLDNPILELTPDQQVLAAEGIRKFMREIGHPID